MTKNFAAQVGRHISAYKSRMDAVFRQSVQDTVREAQTPVQSGGKLPVQTGTLRNSLVSGLNGSTSLTGPESYVLTISQADVSDVVEVGWSASYARHVEFGTSKMTGRGFMRSAAMNWRKHVQRNADRYRT